MTYHLDDILHVCEGLWPTSGAEDWDAPGLVVGRGSSPVGAIHLAVDAARATVDEAIAVQANLLITHHPLLMRGVTTVAEDTYKGKLVADLIRHDVALLAAHTNADVVADGTSQVLARALGVGNTLPLEPGVIEGTGLGCIGTLAAPVTLREFADSIAAGLPATVSGVRVSGDSERSVQRVAICAGAGDSLLGNPLLAFADVYVTSDLRHHPAQEAAEQAVTSGGPALIDISHWAAESLWLTHAAEELRTRLPGVAVSVSQISTDPWSFAVGASA